MSEVILLGKIVDGPTVPMSLDELMDDPGYALLKRLHDALLTLYDGRDFLHTIHIHFAWDGKRTDLTQFDVLIATVEVAGQRGRLRSTVARKFVEDGDLSLFCLGQGRALDSMWAARPRETT